MADDLISFTHTINGQEIAFSFKKMSAEVAIGHMAKVKARWNYNEVIGRELAKVEATPIADRDDHTYLALIEKRERISLEMAKAMKPIFDLIVSPTVDEIEVVMKTDDPKERLKRSDEFQGAIEKYFAKMFPSEDSRKKS